MQESSQTLGVVLDAGCRPVRVERTVSCEECTLHAGTSDTFSFVRVWWWIVVYQVVVSPPQAGKQVGAGCVKTPSALTSSAAKWHAISLFMWQSNAARCEGAACCIILVGRRIVAHTPHAMVGVYSAASGQGSPCPILHPMWGCPTGFVPSKHRTFVSHVRTCVCTENK